MQPTDPARARALDALTDAAKAGAAPESDAEIRARLKIARYDAGDENVQGAIAVTEAADVAEDLQAHVLWAADTIDALLAERTAARAAIAALRRIIAWVDRPYDERGFGISRGAYEGVTNALNAVIGDDGRAALATQPPASTGDARVEARVLRCAEIDCEWYLLDSGPYCGKHGTDEQGGSDAHGHAFCAKSALARDEAGGPG